jgi:hypothetical protein
VHIHRVKYDLFPNIYVLIVSASGKVRKSVAINIGINMLKTAIEDAYIVGDRLSPEGLVKHVNRTVTTVSNGQRSHVGDSSVFLHADELANLFGYDKAMASRLSILLTRLYESQERYTHTTSHEGMRELHNVYFNMLAATAPQNLKVIPDDATGGLLGRLILVTGDRIRKPIAWENEDQKTKDADELLRIALVTDLRQISTLNGEMRATPNAREIFARWYVKQFEIDLKDPKMDAFQSRFHDTAIKIAMLLSVSRSDDLTIHSREMSRGIEIMEHQLLIRESVLSLTGSSDYAVNRGKFLDLLRRYGGVANRQQLMKAMIVPASEFDVIVATLREEGTIEGHHAGKKGISVYRLRTDTITDA